MNSLGIEEGEMIANHRGVLFWNEVKFAQVIIDIHVL